MTQLLEEAMAKVEQLPATEQDAIARRILEELADDQQWNEAFARSQDVLGRLAAKARGDTEAGRTVAMGIDEL